MITLQAPWPGLETTTVLPNPQFNDAQAGQQRLVVKRAMDGTRYTHVHTTESRYKLTYQFSISRMKALELRAFIQAYYQSQVRLTNHKSEVWRVLFTNNPFEFEGVSKAGGLPGNELMNVTIECEGFLMSAPAVPSC
jgi:hypothetical protein